MSGPDHDEGCLGLMLLFMLAAAICLICGGGV